MFVGFGLLYGLCILIPGSLFLAILWTARRMAASDPWMLDIVIKHFKYRRFYSAKSSIGVEHPEIREFIK